MKGPTHVAIGTLAYSNYIMLTNQKIDPIHIPIIIAFSLLPDIDTHSSKISSRLRYLPMNLILVFLFLIYLLAMFYICFIKKILPMYFILITPIMVLFLKFFSKNKILKKISLSLFFIGFYYILYRYGIMRYTKHIFLFLAILPFFEHRSISHSILGTMIIGIILYPIYLDNTLKSYYIVALLSYCSHLFMADIFNKKGIKLFYPLSKKDYSFNIFKSKKIYTNLDIPFMIIYTVITALLFFKIY